MLFFTIKKNYNKESIDEKISHIKKIYDFDYLADRFL